MDSVSYFKRNELDFFFSNVILEQVNLLNEYFDCRKVEYLRRHSIAETNILEEIRSIGNPILLENFQLVENYFKHTFKMFYFTPKSEINLSFGSRLAGYALRIVAHFKHSINLKISLEEENEIYDKLSSALVRHYPQTHYPIKIKPDATNQLKLSMLNIQRVMKEHIESNKFTICVHGCNYDDWIRYKCNNERNLSNSFRQVVYHTICIGQELEKIDVYRAFISYSNGEDIESDLECYSTD